MAYFTLVHAERHNDDHATALPPIAQQLKKVVVPGIPSPPPMSGRVGRSLSVMVETRLTGRLPHVLTRICLVSLAFVVRQAWK